MEDRPAHSHVDPAMEPAHQHQHEHLHHGSHTVLNSADQPVYTTGTTEDPSTIRNGSLNHGAANPHYKGEQKGDYTYSDVEKGQADPISPLSSVQEKPVRSGKFPEFYRKYRVYVHVVIWMLVTAWWVAGLVLHHPGTSNPKNWVVPFLLWLFITLRLVFLHVPISIVTKPMRWTWKNTGSRVNSMIPERLRLPIGALITVAVYLVATFASAEEGENNNENRKSFDVGDSAHYDIC